MRCAFYGRVSTEDQQDPEASRNWQLDRSRQLIAPAGGVILEQFFDIGQSRSLPWKRRPEAARLLRALADPARGFEAVVIGEPQRAFHGNRLSLTFPIFGHHKVELWVPEVGGAIDPNSEAHDLVMTIFGGMSKGERTRIKTRVRSAMGSQARHASSEDAHPMDTSSPTPANIPTPRKQPTANGYTGSSSIRSPRRRATHLR
jgi:site-specific DNA recombinase